MEPSAPLRAKDFSWWSEGGLVANVKQVADEFCRWRNLRQIKLCVVGPPGSGAENVAARVAGHYLHADPPHWCADDIIFEASEAETEAAETLRETIKALPVGKQLPVKVVSKHIKNKLQSNVCRYRGYILESYPLSYEEAEQLFTEREKTGDEGEEEEEEEEAQEDPGEEDGEPPARPRHLDKALAPEFV